ncbi:hypothetical protein MRQ47_004443 [Salmonella enterica]|nr:hypothetical protein [Salmonella enterica]
MTQQNKLRVFYAVLGVLFAVAVADLTRQATEGSKQHLSANGLYYTDSPVGRLITWLSSPAREPQK